MHCLSMSSLNWIWLIHSWLCPKFLPIHLSPSREECPDQIRHGERSIPLLPSRHREQIDPAEESLGCFPRETTKKISPRAASQIDVLSMVACGGWEDRKDRWSIRFLWDTARLKEEKGRLVNFWKSLFPPWTWTGCWNSSNRLCKAFWILRRQHRSTASLLPIRL